MSEIESKTVRRPYVLVAPNGARRGPSDHGALPVTIDQIAETARACHEVGAEGLHLHIRDKNGVHSLDTGLYLEAMAAVTQIVPGMDIQITTESAGLFDVTAQLECLERVRPGWASVSVREVARSPEIAPRIYGLCAEQGTRVQHILYDAADAALLKQWQKAGIVKQKQVDRILVLGRYASNQQSAPQDLDQFPQDSSPWMVCAFGAQEHACLLHAAERGADVRVGFENSLTDQDGNQWKDNTASVAALVEKLERAVS